MPASKSPRRNVCHLPTVDLGIILSILYIGGLGLVFHHLGVPLMKKTLCIFGILALLVSLHAFRTLEQSGNDALKMIGIPEESARNSFLSSLFRGTLSFPQTTQVQETPNSARAGFVQQIGAFVKLYTESAAFAEEYQRERETRKPLAPEAPKSMDAQRKEQKEQLQTSIQQTEEGMKSMSPDLQASMKQVLTELKAQLKSLDDPNNPMFSKEVEEIYKQSYAAQLEEHKQKLTQWQQDYPQDPRELIRRRLMEFLELSQSVDFNAALVKDEQGKKTFANVVYERKPDSWKMCFRAGREAVNAGRDFAQQWLAQLKKSK
jgi:hypothetical protein